MFNYARLNSKGNAKSALREILDCKANKADLRFVVYQLSENHVLCASDDGGPSAVAIYNLSRDTANAILHDATNGFKIAVLAYNMRTNEVYLLDAVPELQVANCLLLCVMNILVGVSDAFTPNRVFEERITARPSGGFVTKTRVVRDANTSRYVRLEGKATDSDTDEIIGRRFRLGHLI